MNIGLNKDELYEIMQEPTKENIRKLLETTHGECNEIDFKKKWTEKSQLAKTVLAIANSGGGVIIVGVKENEDKTLNICGLSEFRDKTEIGHDLETTLPNTLEYEVKEYDYSSSEYEALKGKKLQIVFIKTDEIDLPYIAVGDGKSVNNCTIYIRRDTESVPINNEELSKLMSLRINAELEASSSLILSEHLGQLKELYKHSSEHKIFGAMEMFFGNTQYKNQIDSFIAKKKKRIEQYLEIENINQ